MGYGGGTLASSAPSTLMRRPAPRVTVRVAKDGQTRWQDRNEYTASTSGRIANDRARLPHLDACNSRERPFCAALSCDAKPCCATNRPIYALSLRLGKLILSGHPETRQSRAAGARRRAPGDPPRACAPG